MRLTVRHTSGSRAGQEQSFDEGTIRIGREPSSDIAFDPHKDIVVSGRHAEMAFVSGQWILRDVGSSNGTWIDGDRITSVPLRSGQSVQFGRGGPRVEIRLEGLVTSTSAVSMVADSPGTRVMSINDIVSGKQTHGTARDAAPSGGTTVMPVSALDQTYMEAPAQVPHAPAPNRTLRRVLLSLLVVAVTAVLGIAILLPKKQTPPSVSAAKGSNQSELEALRSQLAEKEARLAELERIRASRTDASIVAPEGDLERQQIETLRRELQEANDAVAALESREPKTIVRYVQVPASSPASSTTTPPRARETAERALPEDSAPAQQADAPRPTASTSESRIETASRRDPEPFTLSEKSSSRQAVDDPAPSSVAAVELPELVKSRTFRKRVNVVVRPTAVATTGAPRGLESDLSRSVTALLASTGQFLVARSAKTSIAIEVKSFRSVEKGGSTKSLLKKASGLGSLLGQSTPSKVGASAGSVSYDVTFTAAVSVLDENGRVLSSATPAASLQDRKSGVSIDAADMSMGDLAATDTPPGDAIRQVVSGIADAAIAALATREEIVSVKSERRGVATLDGGRNIGIGPDDYFAIADPSGGPVLAHLRVSSVQENTATGEILGARNEANARNATRLTGLRAIYLGTSAGAAPSGSTNPSPSVVLRENAEARVGPGSSFEPAAKLQRGNRGRYIYSLGNWVKLETERGSFWLPAQSVELQ